MESSLSVTGVAFGAGGARFEGAAWSGALFKASNMRVRVCFAWLSGLLFPVSWVIWYLVDERAAGGRATRRQRREAL
jgi:hypothetical protein